MAEFGHFGRITPTVCIDAWGAGSFTLSHDGKAYRFEDSDRFGPVLINKGGSVSERQPSERSPFWRLHHLWRKQGRRLAEDGATCIVEVLPIRPTLYRVENGLMIIVQEGDEDGDYIKVEP